MICQILSLFGHVFFLYLQKTFRFCILLFVLFTMSEKKSKTRVIKCVFCAKTTLKTVKKFSTDSLQKCKNVLEYRRSKPISRKPRSTFSHLQLPRYASSDGREGYLSRRYKLFTSVLIFIIGDSFIRTRFSRLCSLRAWRAAGHSPAIEVIGMQGWSPIVFNISDFPAPPFLLTFAMHEQPNENNSFLAD